VWLLDWLIVGLLAVLVLLELVRPWRQRRLLREVDRHANAAAEVLDRAQQRMERTLEQLRQEQQRPEPPAEEPRQRSARRAGGRGSRAYARWAEPGPAETPGEEAGGGEGGDPTAETGLDAEEVEREVSADFGEEPQAHYLHEKIAGLLESSGGARTERERRLLRQLDSTLEMTPGPQRYYREKALYAALKRASQEAAEAGPAAQGPQGEPPQEERELIAKLRGDYQA
jgi:hypothetical protein